VGRQLATRHGPSASVTLAGRPRTPTGAGTQGRPTGRVVGGPDRLAGLPAGLRRRRPQPARGVPLHPGSLLPRGHDTHRGGPPTWLADRLGLTPPGAGAGFASAAPHGARRDALLDLVHGWLPGTHQHGSPRGDGRGG